MVKFEPAGYLSQPPDSTYPQYSDRKSPTGGSNLQERIRMHPIENLASTGSTHLTRPDKYFRLGICYPLTWFAVLIWICIGNRLIAQNTDPKADTYAGKPSANFAEALEQIRQKYDLPGLIAGQFDTRQILQLQTVGLRRWGDNDPLLVSNAMHLGSCTKSMTATMIGLAVDEGLIHWGTTLAEVFPLDAQVTSSPWANVTIEQMMNHTSGAPANPPWSQFTDPQISIREHRRNVLHWWMKQTKGSDTSENPPGFRYSNLGYMTLGAVLEQLRNEPWESQIKDQLFDPLEMRSAGFGVPSKTLGPTAASGHVRKDKILTPIESDNPPALGPAGTVYATMEDWIGYLQFHLRRKPSDTQNISMSEETFRYLHEPRDQQEYAGGWGVIQRTWSKGPIYTHNGSNTYWYCVVYLAPHEGRGILAASNFGLDAAAPCDEALQWMLKNLPFESTTPD